MTRDFALIQIDGFFRAATEKPSPYHYQRRRACDECNNRSETEWLTGGANCHSQLINIPTGLSKTVAVVLAGSGIAFMTRNRYVRAVSIVSLPIRIIFNEETMI